MKEMNFFNEKLGKIRLDYLNTFHNLVRLANFSETAKILGKTQGTISQQLKELEDAFGVILIERNSKQFKITPEGTLFETAITTIFQDLDLLTTEISKAQGKEKKKIVVSSSSIPGEYLLPKLITNFQKLDPEVEFDIKITNTQQSLHDLINGEVNFAAVGGLFNYQENDFESKRIGRDELFLIARKDHPIFNRILSHNEPDPNLSEEDFVKILLEYPWIFREKGSATRELFFEKHAYANSINIALELHNNFAIINTLENSDAITAISKFAYETFQDDREICRIDHPSSSPITRELLLLRRKNESLRSIEQEFWDFVNSNE